MAPQTTVTYRPRLCAETADQIAERWTREWQEGIDETDIYPGFIKTAVDAGPLSEIDRKLIVAAARTHRQTGLTIQTHTGDNVAAPKPSSKPCPRRLHPGAWIWIHAHNLLSVEPAHPGCGAGGLDLVRRAQQRNGRPHTLDLLHGMADPRLFLGQVLLSHDGDTDMNGSPALPLPDDRLHPITQGTGLHSIRCSSSWLWIIRAGRTRCSRGLYKYD